VAGSCKCGNEPSDSVKCGEFLDLLRTCQQEIYSFVILCSAVWETNDDLKYYVRRDDEREMLR
jgi:hypothetical protein